MRKTHCAWWVGVLAIVQPGAFPTEISQKLQFGSDASINDEYKVIAELPNKMGAAIGQLFEATNPNPQDVADAIVRLIEAENGTRPLRTVVDPITGEFIEAANKAVAEQFKKGLTTFGMGELLN
ncbi:MAG: hypothetical protein EOP48_18475 [Sphingobacteriales bacterium]|nr:MAG: hypothetical protein EOP48_18475 [Sphingobacteriales bacterium]